MEEALYVMQAAVCRVSRKVSTENIEATRIGCPTDVRLTSAIEKVVDRGLSG